jgi:proliferating cell nuclear antigen
MQAKMSKDIICLKTVQCSAMRNLFETLKDVLHDCNLVFDSHGIKCLQMDNNNNVIVSVKLNATSFEEYYCKSRFVAGINVGNMFRLLKSIGQSDTLVLRVDERNCNVLYMHIENLDKAMKSTFELNLLDIDEANLEIPTTAFDVVMTMPSLDLQRVCRDLSVLSETIEIINSDRKLLLRAEGDFAKQEVELGEKDNGLFFANANKDCRDQVIRSRYSLKYLNLFSKANVLCSTVDIYLKNDFPMILSYTVASLGKLIFCVAQKADL